MSSVLAALLQVLWVFWGMQARRASCQGAMVMTAGLRGTLGGWGHGNTRPGTPLMDA